MRKVGITVGGRKWWRGDIRKRNGDLLLVVAGREKIEDETSRELRNG